MSFSASSRLAAIYRIPRNGTQKKEFEKKWAKGLSDGTIKATKFRKINGQSGEFAGVKFYSLEYEAEVEYPNGLNTECKAAGFNWACYMKTVRDVGERQQFRETITFEKTENGWRATKSGF